MATYNKFQQFVEDLCKGVHNFVTPDAIKVYLSNTAPDAAANAVKADLAEITNENGYTAPQSVTPVGSESGGTFTFSGTSLTITASGGPLTFRYVVLYNDTPSSPADPLIGWWDYGSALTLQDGESFSIKFNNAAVGSSGTIFTVA